MHPKQEQRTQFFIIFVKTLQAWMAKPHNGWLWWDLQPSDICGVSGHQEKKLKKEKKENKIRKKKNKEKIGENKRKKKVAFF